MPSPTTEIYEEGPRVITDGTSILGQPGLAPLQVEAMLQRVRLHERMSRAGGVCYRYTPDVEVKKDDLVFLQFPGEDELGSTIIQYHAAVVVGFGEDDFNRDTIIIDANHKGKKNFAVPRTHDSLAEVITFPMGVLLPDEELESLVQQAELVVEQPEAKADPATTLPSPIQNLRDISFSGAAYEKLHRRGARLGATVATVAAAATIATIVSPTAAANASTNRVPGGSAVRTAATALRQPAAAHNAGATPTTASAEHGTSGVPAYEQAIVGPGATSTFWGIEDNAYGPVTNGNVPHYAPDGGDFLNEQTPNQHYVPTDLQEGDAVAVPVQEAAAAFITPLDQEGIAVRAGGPKVQVADKNLVLYWDTGTQDFVVGQATATVTGTGADRTIETDKGPVLAEYVISVGGATPEATAPVDHQPELEEPVIRDPAPVSPTASPKITSLSTILGITPPMHDHPVAARADRNPYGAEAPSTPAPTETAPTPSTTTPTSSSPKTGNQAPTSTSPFDIMTHPDSVKEIPSSETNLGGVVYYSQTDPRWSFDAYHGKGGEGTIGYDGCGATSLAIAISTFSNRMVTPEQIAPYNMEHGYVTANSAATYDDAMTHVPEAYGVRSYPIPVDRASVEDVLKAGGLVIIDGNTHKASGFPTPATPDGHFYVIRGMNRAGGWLIANPDDTVPLNANSESNVPWNPEHILLPADVAYAVFPGQGVAYTHSTQPTHVAAPAPATTPTPAPTSTSSSSGDTAPSHESRVAAGGYLDSNDIWHSNIERNRGPYTVESYAINVLQAIAAMKRVPVENVVTPQHVLALVMWAYAEGDNIAQPQYLNLYNGGLTSAPELVAGAVNSSGLESARTFDDGATLNGWIITEQGAETNPWQTRLAGVLTDPNSTVQDFIRVLVNPENYPDNLGWAGGQAVYDPQYQSDLEYWYGQVIKNYSQFASYEIGQGFEKGVNVNYLPDTLLYRMVSPGVLVAIQPSQTPATGGPTTGPSTGHASSPTTPPANTPPVTIFQRTSPAGPPAPSGNGSGGGNQSNQSDPSQSDPNQGSPQHGALPIFAQGQ
jgi:hypothetical protein